jgi:hypothetical protein
MAKLRRLLDDAVKETLSMHNGPFERWRLETPGAPFGPSIAAGDEFGSYQTSNKAMHALAEIADTLQKNDEDFDRTINQDTMRLETATTLGELLNDLGRSADVDANWARYRKRLLERLDRRRGRLTHYFPVWLFIRQEATDFEVGPVKFVSPENWIREIEKRRGQRSTWIDGVLDAWNGRGETKDRPVNVQSVSRSVLPDQWVACVTVNGFEPAESYRRALLATRSALDTLRLIVPATHNALIAMAVDHGPPRVIDRLSQREGEDLAHGSSVNKRGVSGAPGLAQDLIVDSIDLRAVAGRRIEVALQADATVTPCRKLSERWLNAVHWYGRACSDEADFAATVNFVIALDILSGGLEQAGILELAARLSQTPYDRTVTTDGVTLKKLVDRLYGYRSEIAHGSILALDARMRTERAQAESLAATMLFGYAIQLDKHVAAGGEDDRDAFRNALPAVPAGP